jgi:ArsR family transcriptional regulator
MDRAQVDMDTDQFEPAAKLFKALMHPGRLAILEILRNGEECLCHMEAVLGFRQAYLSQQLSVLREAGLVEVRREGWNIYYRIIQPEVFGVLDAALRVTGQRKRSTTRKAARVAKADCRCPKCAPVTAPAAG